jgi:DNA helicase-2/ATP-dependent DNA helicase PcrA
MAQLDHSKGSSSGGSSQLDDIEALEQVAALQPDPAQFEPWLRQLLGRRPDPDGVVLATVHKVKGQEWPHVVVFGATDGLMPHRLAQDLEEERRVLHVGITRGQREVVVLADQYRGSPFLAELEEPAPPDRPAAVAASAARAADGGRPASRIAAPPDVLDPDALALFERLRGWRLEVARRDAVAPFIVFSDKVLKDVARRRPADAVALGRISGIGPTKVERYGDAVLAIVNA